MPNVLTESKISRGHAWKVAAEGTALRTRCVKCSLLFREWWEGRERVPCPPPADHPLDDAERGAD